MTAQPNASLVEGNESILIVDDDDAVREQLRRGFEKRGYLVLSACNGEEALQAADRHNGPIHLVISDVVMPEMNGLQLHARLRSWYPAIRFLFISGYSRMPLSEEEIEDERTAFLPKPFTVSTLARKGRALLDDRGPRATQPRMRLMAER
jgi:two-component system, cell cycle sensor histidine kinase and response regulator CckA